MAGELIVSLRQDVRDAILSNQQKYNPNFNGTVDEDEIALLLSDFKAGNLSELSAEQPAAGLAVEKEDSQSNIANNSPKIILSSSGFCTNGRVVNYLKKYLKDYRADYV